MMCFPGCIVLRTVTCGVVGLMHSVKVLRSCVMLQL